MLLSPSLESWDDRCAPLRLGLDSHEQFLSSQAIEGEWCTAVIRYHLMRWNSSSSTCSPFLSALAAVGAACQGCALTPLSSRTELALSFPFSVYLLVSESLPQSGGALGLFPLLRCLWKLLLQSLGSASVLGPCQQTAMEMGGGYLLKQRGLGLPRLEGKPLLSELLKMHPQRTPQTSPPSDLCLCVHLSQGYHISDLAECSESSTLFSPWRLQDQVVRVILVLIWQNTVAGLRQGVFLYKHIMRMNFLQCGL